jgi:hypothetical protein
VAGFDNFQTFIASTIDAMLFANRFVKWAELRDAVAGFDNFQTFIASTIDAIITDSLSINRAHGVRNTISYGTNCSILEFSRTKWHRKKFSVI